MITVNTVKEAWKKADELFPTDYMKDDVMSEKAGYDIYYSTAKGNNSWISDLGDRIEVNLENGKTINIWIKPCEYKEYQVEDALAVISDALYEIDDKVNWNLAKETGIKVARDTLYGAYAKLRDILDIINPDSKLYKMYNLNEA